MNPVLERGELFAGYTIGRLLGAGGMGEVYQARHPRLPRSDALKILGAGTGDDPGFRHRFEREADLSAQLSHPNIVRVHDRGEFDGKLWISLELIDGPDVAELARRTAGGLPPAQVANLIAEVAKALDFAHSRGFLHRDVKPANILIDSHGRILLTDFGIARLQFDEVGLTGTGMTLGTVSYSSPEQLHGGTLDARSDQYSLACTAFHLLTGRPPFENSNAVAVIAAHLSQPVPSVRPFHPALSNDVDAVIGRAMAKDPQHRFASCSEFAHQLAIALNGNDVNARTVAAMPSPPAAPWPRQPSYPVHPPGPPQLAAASRSRRKWPWIAAAIVVIGVVAIAGGMLVLGKGWLGRLGGGVGTVKAWDDRLYPEEQASITRGVSRESLDIFSSPPKARWTLPMTGGRAFVAGGNADVVLVTVSSHLIALKADKGEPLWPLVNLQSGPRSCALKDNRIACVAPPSSGSDSTVTFLNADSGAILRTVKVPGSHLDKVTTVSDRFVVTTESSVRSGEKGHAIGYTTEGEEAWRRETNGENYVKGRFLVDGRSDSSEVVFVSPADGHEVLRVAHAKGALDGLYWDIFDNGIAVQNADFTGADFYDNSGKKTASISGWEPAGYPNPMTNPHPLPLLTRIDAPRGYEHDQHTIAAANPKTGHLLWRISDPGIRSRRLNTIDAQPVVQIANPNSPAAPKVTDAWFRVYDCYKGEAKSPAIDMSGSTNVEVYWIGSNRYQLVNDYIEDRPDLPYVTRAFTIGDGVSAWELRFKQRPQYAERHMFVAENGGISLFQ